MNNVSFSIQRREGPRQLSMIVPKLCIWENHPVTCLGSSWEDFSLEDCSSPYPFWFKNICHSSEGKSEKLFSQSLEVAQSQPHQQ